MKEIVLYLLAIGAIIFLFGLYYGSRYNRVYDPCIAAGNADWYCEAMARAAAR